MKRIVNIGLVALMCFMCGNTFAQSMNEFTGFQSPESIVAFRDTLYVSNMGANNDPSTKDGDGFISKISRRDGKMIQEKFITGLHSPKGLMVKHGCLYIADVDRILVYRLKDSKKMNEISMATQAVVYANDMAKRNCNSIFVSATDKNAIYIVKKNGEVKQLEVKGSLLEGVNGIYKKCCKLFVANYGRGTSPAGNYGKLNLCSKKYKMYKAGGIYDGIVPVCGKLIVSDWQSNTDATGRLVVYKKCKNEEKIITMYRGIKGPSDIFVDHHSKTIWIPAMMENKLVAVFLKDVIKKAKEKN